MTTTSQLLLMLYHLSIGLEYSVLVQTVSLLFGKKTSTSDTGWLFSIA